MQHARKHALAQALGKQVQRASHGAAKGSSDHGEGQHLEEGEHEGGSPEEGHAIMGELIHSIHGKDQVSAHDALDELLRRAIDRHMRKEGEASHEEVGTG